MTHMIFEKNWERSIYKITGINQYFNVHHFQLSSNVSTCEKKIIKIKIHKIKMQKV